MIRSRLSKRMEQKTKKNLALSILGIILVVLLAFKFGVPFLVNFSLFLSGSQNKVETSIQGSSFIAPPVLDSFPEATTSAEVIISGIASKKQTVNLYINSYLVDTAKSGDDGKFSFRQTIKPGENMIQAKSVVNEKESDFSNTIITAFKNAPPSLSLNSPTNEQSFSKDQNIANIRGTTDADVKVTINGFWAITDSNGNFSYNLPLQNGENGIRVEAIDVAGNQSVKEIKVTYSL
ncbi:MAG: hypothetical protein Q8P29_01815 [Candidatus Levybacteria bacterium]|nr:hypothetical protein [Candidatus Levybacteria bacterium]